MIIILIICSIITIVTCIVIFLRVMREVLERNNRADREEALVAGLLMLYIVFLCCGILYLIDLIETLKL